MHKGVLYALLAAALFGASTPFSKQLTGSVEPCHACRFALLG